MTNETLTRKDAFNLMKDFLEAYWRVDGEQSDDIASLLGSLGASGKDNYLPMDPALWQIWNEAADRLEAYQGDE